MSAFWTIRSAILFSILVAVKPGRALLHDEPEHVIALGVAGPHDDEIGERRVADPALCAVEHPLIPVAARGRLQAAGDVGAAVRLGQRERTDLLHSAHRRQPAASLLLGAEPVDRADPQAGVHAKERRERRIGVRELHRREAGHEVARFLLGRVWIDPSDEPELGEPVDQFERKLRSGPVAIDDWRGLGAQELTEPLQRFPIRRRQQLAVGVQVSGQWHPVPGTDLLWAAGRLRWCSSNALLLYVIRELVERPHQGDLSRVTLGGELLDGAAEVGGLLGQ